jgi:hypothetical protein
MYVCGTSSLTILCIRDVHCTDLPHGPTQYHYWHLHHATDPAAGSSEIPSRLTTIVLLHASNSRDALRLLATAGTTVPFVTECIVGYKLIRA